MNSAWSEATRQAVEQQVARLSGSVEADLRESVAADFQEWFEANLPADATPQDVARLAAEAGPVDDVALDEVEDPTEAGETFRRGRILGIPYDFTTPTGRKIGSRLWDPTDPRLVRPHVFGIGWAPNLGAVAVRLGLIEPDAEDVPFANTSQGAFAATLAVPAAVAAATLLHYAVVPLADELPRHWDWRGRPDRFSRRQQVASADITSALALVAAAGWAASADRAPGISRAGVGAVSGGLATALAAQVVMSSRPARPVPAAPPLVVLAVAATTTATLWGLARSGRAGEIRRDRTR